MRLLDEAREERGVRARRDEGTGNKGGGIGAATANGMIPCRAVASTFEVVRPGSGSGLKCFSFL